MDETETTLTRRFDRSHGRAFAGACKALGTKHTRKAIAAFLEN
jgi:hypothetical protein